MDDDAKQKYIEASQFYQERDFASALTAFEDLLHQYIDDRRLLKAKALCLIGLQRFSEVEATVASIERVHGQDAATELRAAVTRVRPSQSDSEKSPPKSSEGARPGTIVAKSGVYRCVACARNLESDHGKGHESEDHAEPETKLDPAEKQFNLGATLTECPHCLAETSWSCIREVESVSRDHLLGVLKVLLGVAGAIGVCVLLYLLREPIGFAIKLFLVLAFWILVLIWISVISYIAYINREWIRKVLDIENSWTRVDSTSLGQTNSTHVGPAERFPIPQDPPPPPPQTRAAVNIPDTHDDQGRGPDPAQASLPLTTYVDVPEVTPDSDSKTRSKNLPSSAPALPSRSDVDDLPDIAELPAIEIDNMGTRLNDGDEVRTHKQSREANGNGSPFLAYKFAEKKIARDALCSVPGIEIAGDTDELISLEDCFFGCYRDEDQWNAYLEGDKISHETWTNARNSFIECGGTCVEELEPEN